MFSKWGSDENSFCKPPTLSQFMLGSCSHCNSRSLFSNVCVNDSLYEGSNQIMYLILISYIYLIMVQGLLNLTFRNSFSPSAESSTSYNFSLGRQVSKLNMNCGFLLLFRYFSHKISIIKLGFHWHWVKCLFTYDTDLTCFCWQLK